MGCIGSIRMVTTGRHGSDLPSSATTSGDVESDAADTAKELKQQMMAVRLTAAETEVERLRKELRRELDRKRAHVPTQQQQGQLHARRSTTKPPKPATNKRRHNIHSSTSASMSRPRNVGGEYGYHDDAHDDEEDEDEDEDEFAADEGEEVARDDDDNDNDDNDYDDDDDSDEGTGRHGQAETPQSIARTLLRRCKTRGDDVDDVWTLPERLQIDEDAQALVRRVHDLRRRTATDLQHLLSALRGRSRRRRRPPAAPTTTTATTTTTPTTTTTTPTPAKTTATTTTITAPNHSSTNAASASSTAAVAVATVKSLKTQIAQLREDMARKNKVIAALKEAKAADSNALEQWKNEARLLDEAHKRLQRALTAKEAVVKDLRQKLDQALEASQQQQQQQQLLHHAGDHGDHGDGGERDGTEARTGDIYLLNAQELRSRLKEYDLERARYRARLQATRDKVQELEAQLASLAQENEALKKGQDKVAEYKVIVARKESLILSLRGQLDVKQKEIEALQSQEQQKQVDAERRIRSLQRQVDAALRHQQEFERETALLRQRVTQAVEHDKKRELTHRASGLHQQQHQHQAKAPPGAFHFSLQGQQAPMSPASTVVPSAAARMHRAVAFAPSNSATQRLSDVSRSLLHSDDALYPIGDVDDSDLNSSSTATRGQQHHHHHSSNSNSNNSNNNNHDHHHHHHHHRSSTESLSQSRGDDDDVESLLMQTLGISAQRPSSNTPSSSFHTNHANTNANANANANANTHVSAMGGGTSDLLARLTGLAHILPPPPPSHHHHHPSVLDQTDSQSLLNLSSPSVSQPNHNHTNNNSNSNNSSSSGGSVSADSVQVDGLSSAEKRLQALVDAALLSPARK